MILNCMNDRNFSHFYFLTFKIFISLLIGFYSLISQALEIRYCPSGLGIENEYLIRIPVNDLSLNAIKNQKLLLKNFENMNYEFIHKNKITKNHNKLSLNNTADLLHLKVNKNSDLAYFINEQRALSVEQVCKVKIENFNTNDFDSLNANYLKQINFFEAYKILPSKLHTVVVAVSDTGVDYNHKLLNGQIWINNPELNGKPNFDDDNNGCVDDIYGCDFGNNDGDPYPSNYEGSEHGTHVAGLIAGNISTENNFSGINANAKIMSLKGFPDNLEYATSAMLLKSIYYAVDNGAKIINCSWGSTSLPTFAEIDAFAYAKDHEVIVVVAAGNGATDAKYYSPASLKSVLTIGSINSVGKLSAFSNYGDLIDIVAPGGDIEQFGAQDESITSLFPGDQFGDLKGTSMSAPIVSGVISLLLSINPNLKYKEVLEIIKSSGDMKEFSPPRQPNLLYNYPQLNAQSAVKKVLQITNIENGEQSFSCDQSQINCVDNLNSSNLKEVKKGLENSLSGCSKGYEVKESNEAAFIQIILLLFPFYFLFQLIFKNKKNPS